MTNNVATVGCITAPEGPTVTGPQLRACIRPAAARSSGGMAEWKTDGNPIRGLLLGLGLCLPFWAVVVWLIARAIHLFSL